MPCFTPTQAYQSKTQRNPNTGKSIIRFRKCQFVGGTEPIKVHCAKCEGCRLSYARSWAIRCWHEATTHDNNIFITLTFANLCPINRTRGRSIIPIAKEKRVDPTHSLHLFHFQDFMKRLRKRFSAHANAGILYFHAAEYGEKFGRPHHHACLFNFKFPDQILTNVRRGNRVYTSEILSELWPYGIHEIGELNYKSAAYAARYILKKVPTKYAYKHYQDREPEFTTMSTRPAIAKNWILQNMSDVYPHDQVSLDGGLKVIPPKYYDNKYELLNPENFATLKTARIARAKQDPNNTPERLAARHEIIRRKLQLLKRGYENESSNNSSP